VSAEPRDETHGVLGEEPAGATPREHEELVDLIPDFVATRADLNLVEYENIVAALPWADTRARRGGVEEVLSYQFLLQLHRRMFGDVWKWAGAQRRRGTNIGVDPSQITTLTKHALDDAVWWHDNKTFHSDELAARVHHRLVAIHPFPNGNGRCTRLVADLYLRAIGRDQFTWGNDGLETGGATRTAYLSALRAADGDDLAPLLAFARS